MKLVKVSIAVRCCDIVRFRWYLRCARVGFEHVVEVERGAEWEKSSGRDWRAVWVA